jgi:hypothetical protein
VYRIRKGATYPHPAGEDHDCGHERHARQDRKCPRLQHCHAGPGALTTIQNDLGPDSFRAIKIEWRPHFPKKNHP